MRISVKKSFVLFLCALHFFHCFTLVYHTYRYMYTRECISHHSTYTSR